MSAEEFRISISGPTAAFFLYECANRPTDFEGLLFGDYRRCLHREVSDHDDAGDRNRPGTIIHDIYIRRVVPTGVRFSFYDRNYKAALPNYVGNVVNEMCVGNGYSSQSVKNAKGGSASSRTQNDNSETTVRSGFFGWFRYQHCSPVRMYSESMICRALLSADALRDFPPFTERSSQPKPGQDLSAYYPWPGNGPLYLFAHPSARNNILAWDIQVKAFNRTSGQFRPVRTQIRNLGDTTHADYWKLGGGGVTVAAGVDSLLPGLVPPDLSMQLVENTDRMAETAKVHLKQACEEVLDETQKALDNWIKRRTKISAPSAADYVKFGYAPTSSQEVQVLLDNLHFMIGSKPSVLKSNSGNSANFSQKSDDLFDVVTASQASSDGSSDHEANACAEGWTKVDKTGLLEGELSGTPLPDTQEAIQDNLDAFVSTVRGCKRPKENTSSSSSGATSDELPETASGCVSTIDTAWKSTSSIPHIIATVSLADGSSAPVQQRDSQGKPDKVQSQRKKSKGSDNGSGADTPTAMAPKQQSAPPNLPVPTYSSPRLPAPGSPLAHGSGAISPSSVSPASHVRPAFGKGRGRGEEPLPVSKGRGRHISNDIPPPPGFPRANP